MPASTYADAVVGGLELNFSGVVPVIAAVK